MNAKYGLIISYWLKGRLPVERTRFNRKFLGYIDKSRYGEYSYFREGLISAIPHVHVSNSLFIIFEEDLKVIKDFCDNHGVDLFIRKVVVTESDTKALQNE